jgi:hypothetical protein
VPNRVKYALGLQPFVSAAQPLVAFRLDSGAGVLTYLRPAAATDVTYHVKVSSDLASWTETGVTQQSVGTTNGLEIWEARYAGPPGSIGFFRLALGY